MFNLTNAIAMSALDCHFTLLSYIVVIIIDSIGIDIIVGLGFMGRGCICQGFVIFYPVVLGEYAFSRMDPQRLTAFFL